MTIIETFRKQAQQGLVNIDEDVIDLTFEQVRAEFPIAARRTYLNNASIGPMSNLVMASVETFLSDVRDNGRNNYPHWCAYAEDAIKSRIGRLIGAKSSEIAFAKNTTEGLVAVANGLDWREGDNLVLPSIEYPSNVYCWQRLAKQGVTTKWIEPVNGVISVDSVAEAIDRRTRLVSISAVQFSNGYRHDLDALQELCRSRGVLLNLDAIQWVGALHLDLSSGGVDFLSYGGHKWMLSPIGTGVFYCNERALDQLTPSMVGYHTVAKSEAHMDYDLTDYRPGAARFEAALENFPGIWGMDAAVKTVLGLGTRAVEAHILSLVEHASERLRARGWTINSPHGPCEMSGILSFSGPVDVVALETRLRDAKIDIALRAGRARISPSYHNTLDDIDTFVDALPTF